MAVSVLAAPQAIPYATFSRQVSFSIGGAPVYATEPRKRTTSFSCSSSRPRKLLRTESVVDLASLAHTSNLACATPLTTPPAIPYSRSLKYYKEQRDRKNGVSRRDKTPQASSFPEPQSKSCATRPSPNTTTSSLGATPLPPRQPPTSPLARDGRARALVLPTPSSSFLACGPAHPPPPTARTRSKPKAQADLHRRALTACMRESPEGAKILRMGARLAVEIMSATMELERLCGDDLLSDEDALGEIDVDEEDVAVVEAMVEDIEMEDPQPTLLERHATPEPEPVMSASWVVIAGQPVVCGREIAREYGQKEDWEMVMVECAA